MEGEKRRYEQMRPAVRLASASGWPRPPRRPPLPVRAQLPVAAAGLAPRAALVTTPISSSLLHHLPLTENERRSKFDGRTSFPSLSVVISTGGTLSPSTVALFDHWRGLLPAYGLFSRLLFLSFPSPCPRLLLRLLGVVT